MTPKQLKDVLRKTLPAGLPVLIKGAPGVGKSDIIAQVAEELKMDLIISHPVVSDPTDFKGLPGIVDGKAEFLPFGDLRLLITAKKPTIAFLDDLGQAPAAVQAAAMQLIVVNKTKYDTEYLRQLFTACAKKREISLLAIRIDVLSTSCGRIKGSYYEPSHNLIIRLPKAGRYQCFKKGNGGERVVAPVLTPASAHETVQVFDRLLQKVWGWSIIERIWREPVDWPKEFIPMESNTQILLLAEKERIQKQLDKIEQKLKVKGGTK